MKTNRLSIICAAIFLFTACNSPEDHFISDPHQRADVESDFNKKKTQLSNGDLFNIFDTQLSTKEREALQFLYAYMPIGDITDYSGEYYKENIDIAFRAKEEMPWGNEIPEREFNHFVLPLRTNNENLDDFRTLYYDELKSRVQQLSLYDAILEVNHWCHEHANYKGSDSRTSSPMATMKTSWGRCGEESTFLVTALRTIGIPARQVYTPRWAHCDDNHAWVEAYVDGGWHFLGACEPEPVLDLGWFNEPASRALLLHTRVFGRYYGPEEVIERTANHTEINVVDNYGDTAKTTFKVVDTEGTPQSNITVEFKIYNYAEFCTVVSKQTDENGETWLTSGLGSMMAYAANNGKFGFQVFKPGEIPEVTIILDHEEGSDESFDLEMIPPVAKPKTPEVNEKMSAENNRRGAIEDSIRNTYIAKCKQDQQQLIAQTGNKSLCCLYEKSWGNYQTLADFVQYAESKGQFNKAIDLLQSISDKDLRDVSADVLIDHLDYTTDQDNEYFVPYILNPRVSNEMIRPYKQTFSKFFTNGENEAFRANPQNLVDWVKQNISINNDLNIRQIPMFPTGVLRSRIADSHSRDIFFVAMARSIGIAAQVNPVTGKVQYFNRAWIPVDFDAAQAIASTVGFLDIQYDRTVVADPKYYTHFSIKRFNGTSFELLSYDAKDPGIDDGMTLSSFDHPTPLEAGYYILTSGTRMSNGTALTHSEFFTIQKGDTTTIKLILRQPDNGVSIIGNFNAENRFTTAESGEEKSVLNISGRNFYILGILDQGSEPTTHAMQDISAFKNDFENCGLQLLFMFNDKDSYAQFKLKSFNELPSNITYGINQNMMQNEIVNNLHLGHTNLPIFIIANSNNEVVFVSQGYTIGLGEQLLKVVKML